MKYYTNNKDAFGCYGPDGLVEYDLDEIKEAFSKAFGKWLDLSWVHCVDHRTKNGDYTQIDYQCVKNLDDLAGENLEDPESVLEEILEYREAVELDAILAQDLAIKAMKELENLDFVEAHRLANRAAELEGKYGYSPVWGPLEVSLRGRQC